MDFLLTNSALLDNIIFILLVLGLVLFILYVVTFFISIKLYQASFKTPKSFPRGKKTKKWQKYSEQIDKTLDELDALDKEELFITGCNNLKLHATFIKSNTNSKKVIVFSHGWKNTGFNDYACGGYFYHRLGYNVLILDHSGHGQSEGKHITFGYFDHKNVIKWVEVINEKFNYDCQIYLHGLSMGASTVAWTADVKMDNVHGIIFDSGFCNGYELASYIVKKNVKFLPSVILFNARILCLIFAKFDLKKCDIRKALQNSKYPILFLHGDKDDFVPTSHSINAYEITTSKKKIKLFDDATHIIAGVMHPKAYQDEVISFIEEN